MSWLVVVAAIVAVDVALLPDPASDVLTFIHRLEKEKETKQLKMPVNSHTYITEGEMTARKKSKTIISSFQWKTQYHALSFFRTHSSNFLFPFYTKMALGWMRVGRKRESIPYESLSKIPCSQSDTCQHIIEYFHPPPFTLAARLPCEQPFSGALSDIIHCNLHYVW